MAEEKLALTNLEMVEKFQAMDPDVRRMKVQSLSGEQQKALFGMLGEGLKEQRGFEGAITNEKDFLSSNTLDTAVRAIDAPAGAARSVVAAALEKYTGRDVLNEGRAKKAATLDDSFQDFDDILDRAFPGVPFLSGGEGKLSVGDALDFIVDPLNFIPGHAVTKGFSGVSKLAGKMAPGLRTPINAVSDIIESITKVGVGATLKPEALLRRVSEKIFEFGIPAELKRAGKFGKGEVAQILVEEGVVGNIGKMQQRAADAVVRLGNKRDALIARAQKKLEAAGKLRPIQDTLKPVYDKLEKAVGDGLTSEARSSTRLITRESANQIKSDVLSAATGISRQEFTTNLNAWQKAPKFLVGPAELNIQKSHFDAAAIWDETAAIASGDKRYRLEAFKEAASIARESVADMVGEALGPKGRAALEKLNRKMGTILTVIPAQKREGLKFKRPFSQTDVALGTVFPGFIATKKAADIGFSRAFTTSLGGTSLAALNFKAPLSPVRTGELLGSAIRRTESEELDSSRKVRGE